MLPRPKIWHKSSSCACSGAETYQDSTTYLHATGPLYGFFGVGLVLFFASQGDWLRIAVDEMKRT
jgi:hypothetical protein